MPSILSFVTRRRPTGAGERGRHDAQIHSAEARGVGYGEEIARLQKTLTSLEGEAEGRGRRHHEERKRRQKAAKEKKAKEAKARAKGEM